MLIQIRINWITAWQKPLIKYKPMQKKWILIKLVKVLNKLNKVLKETTKSLGGIYIVSQKMISFASMAGIGAIAAMGAGIANFGKGYINNQHKAKVTGIKNFGGRSIQAIQNMSELITGNKDDLYNIIAHIQDNKTSINTSLYLLHYHIKHITALVSLYSQAKP